MPCCQEDNHCNDLNKGIVRLKSGTAEQPSCIQNHGGMNCSDAFGIWGSNCVTKRNKCMDFNGTTVIAM
jgi:hypothetical protein